MGMEATHASENRGFMRIKPSTDISLAALPEEPHDKKKGGGGEGTKSH